MDGSNVLERLEDPASLIASFCIKISSSNRQPKANNPLNRDAVMVRITRFRTHTIKGTMLYTVFATSFQVQPNIHAQSVLRESCYSYMCINLEDVKYKKVRKFNPQLFHTKYQTVRILFCKKYI